MNEINENHKIIIVRKKELNNRLRRIQLLMDSEKIEKLMFEEKIIELGENSEVRLKAKIDWCYSPEIKLKFERKELSKKVLIYSQISNYYIIILFVLAITGLILMAVNHSWFYIIPFFIMYLRPLYFVTFGRKKYLKILEVRE